jgi:hypothetical protein
LIARYMPVADPAVIAMLQGFEDSLFTRGLEGVRNYGGNRIAAWSWTALIQQLRLLNVMIADQSAPLGEGGIAADPSAYIGQVVQWIEAGHLRPQQLPWPSVTQL